MDSWFYKFLAFFPITGLLGIDKLALRSPLTAAFKLVINLFFWGAWYIYDIIQITIDNDFVGKYGFSTPYGVSGHGYRLLNGISKIDAFEKASPYNGGLLASIGFIVFVIMTLFIGFTGFPAILAGDFYGGLLKFFSNFLILPFFFYLFAQILETVKSGSLEKEGVNHAWPLFPMFTIFEKYPALNFLGEEQYKTEENAQKKREETAKEQNLQPQLIQIFNSIKDGGRDLLVKVWPAARVVDAVDKVADTATDLQQTVRATGELAKSAAQTGKTILGAVEKEATKHSKEIADSLLGIQPQQGGGSSIFPAELDTIMLMAMGALIVGGFAAALLRKFALPRRQDDDEYPRKVYERDDAPPNPGRV